MCVHEFAALVLVVTLFNKVEAEECVFNCGCMRRALHVCVGASSTDWRLNYPGDVLSGKLSLIWGSFTSLFMQQMERREVTVSQLRV